MYVLAAFAPTSEETAIFYLIAVVAYGLAAFVGATGGRFPGGAIRLIGLGLFLSLFPTMWNTVDVAFQ